MDQTTLPTAPFDATVHQDIAVSYDKPNLTVPEMITWAILTSPGEKATTEEIRNKIRERWPYYQDDGLFETLGESIKTMISRKDRLFERSEEKKTTLKARYWVYIGPIPDWYTPDPDAPLPGAFSEPASVNPEALPDPTTDPSQIPLTQLAGHQVGTPYLAYPDPTVGHPAFAHPHGLNDAHSLAPAYASSSASFAMDSSYLPALLADPSTFQTDPAAVAQPIGYPYPGQYPFTLLPSHLNYLSSPVFIGVPPQAVDDTDTMMQYVLANPGGAASEGQQTLHDPPTPSA